jgi:hypothetical protein
LGDYFKVNLIAADTAADATDLIGWLNSHGKVRVIFNNAQQTISRRAGTVKTLAYLVANLTRWTTHYIAFHRLHLLKDPLRYAVLGDRQAIIDAQVGAAQNREKEKLEASANRYCDLINDSLFWSRLETVLEDIEPITYGTNINQSDSTWPDQVLLTIAGIYLHFVTHPEADTAKHMCSRIEKRWKDCDQPLFILALVLNPFEGLSAFGDKAGLNPWMLHSMLLTVSFSESNKPEY